ncbi:Unknown protein, partial [Striga hermonthica]
SMDGFPWMVSGDFNIFLYPDERVGGRTDRSWEMWDFVQTVADCELIDAGCESDPFTWVRDDLKKRLDRALVTEAWSEMFAVTVVTHLTRFRSDHSPLLIRCRFSSIPRQASFRFQNMWVRHHSFHDTVRDSWLQPTGLFGMHNLEAKLGRLRRRLRQWNWDVFGNLHQRLPAAQSAHVEDERVVVAAENSLVAATAMNRYLHRFWGIAQETGFLSRNQFLGKNSVSWQETSFRSRNQFLGKKLVSWQETSFSLKKRVSWQETSFMARNLFLAQETSFLARNMFLGKKPVSWQETCFSLKKPVSWQETCFLARNLFFAQETSFLARNQFLVKKPVSWRERNNLATHSDLNTNIHIKQSHDIHELNENRSLRLIRRFNVKIRVQTNPKITILEFFTLKDEFLSKSKRKICSGVQKCEQHSKLGYNIMKTSHKSLLYCIPQHMAKAYDRVEWLFLREALARMGFPERWISFVEACVEHCTFSVLVNGSPTDFFPLSRGLRQGDPLS